MLAIIGGRPTLAHISLGQNLLILLLLHLNNIENVHNLIRLEFHENPWNSELLWNVTRRMLGCTLTVNDLELIWENLVTLI